MMKQDWKKGWKIIMSYSRRSCTNDGHEVTYETNEITKRPNGCGPLAVFEIKKMARTFLKKFRWNTHDRKIVKCLYKKSEDNHLWCKGYFRYGVPNGTRFADEVKCLE